MARVKEPFFPLPIAIAWLSSLGSLSCWHDKVVSHPHTLDWIKGGLMPSGPTPSFDRRKDWGLERETSSRSHIKLPAAMAPHSSTLAWKIPWMEEPGRLQSMGLLRVRHDWVTSLSLFIFMHWRGKWQPTPVFLPGESQGRGSLVGCHLWGLTESDTTEAT